MALLDRYRHAARDFQHYVPELVRIDGTDIRVFLGSLAAATSPVRSFPLLGAKLFLAPRASVSLDVRSDFEHGVLVDQGTATLSGTALARAELGYLAPGNATITLTNETDGTARVILLGEPPFGEEIVMWAISSGDQRM
ncbi:hypothetical protein ABT119_18105 [Streptomyces sp. NPDC001910]|uniref:hypothetical protein n=1 Tax=Streptomyces sp. NPDC001910 TaxID=3154403 RepID=UPI0033172C02